MSFGRSTLFRKCASVQSKFATDLKRTEAKIKEECENFKALLLTLESYGGQEEIEY